MIDFILNDLSSESWSELLSTKCKNCLSCDNQFLGIASAITGNHNTAPIIKILWKFYYNHQHVHANKSFYLFPVGVHIFPCFFFFTLYRLVFSTTKSIKESGKKNKKYCIGVQSVPGGLLKVPLTAVLAGGSIFLFFHRKTYFLL